MFRVAQNKQFGKSSEVCPDQGDFFNEAESVSDEESDNDIEQEEPETASLKRKKPTRSKLPMDMLRKTIIHDISDDDKQCDCCGYHFYKMGEDKNEKLEFVLAQIKVVEHIRPKLSCRHCIGKKEYLSNMALNSVVKLCRRNDDNVLASGKLKCFMIIMQAEQAPVRLNSCRVTQAICKSMVTKGMHQLKRY
jgi:hypothetical protein